MGGRDLVERLQRGLGHGFCCFLLCCTNFTYSLAWTILLLLLDPDSSPCSTQISLTPVRRLISVSPLFEVGGRRSGVLRDVTELETYPFLSQTRNSLEVKSKRRALDQPKV